MIFFRTLTFSIGLVKKATGVILDIFWNTEERNWEDIEENWEDWGG